jgi:hypothetical protein
MVWEDTCGAPLTQQYASLGGQVDTQPHTRGRGEGVSHPLRTSRADPSQGWPQNSHSSPPAAAAAAAGASLAHTWCASGPGASCRPAPSAAAAAAAAGAAWSDAEPAPGAAGGVEGAKEKAGLPAVTGRLELMLWSSSCSSSSPSCCCCSSCSGVCRPWARCCCCCRARLAAWRPLLLLPPCDKLPPSELLLVAVSAVSSSYCSAAPACSSSWCWCCSRWGGAKASEESGSGRALLPKGLGCLQQGVTAGWQPWEEVSERSDVCLQAAPQWLRRQWLPPCAVVTREWCQERLRSRQAVTYSSAAGVGANQSCYLAAALPPSCCCACRSCCEQSWPPLPAATSCCHLLTCRSWWWRVLPRRRSAPTAVGCTPGSWWGNPWEGSGEGQ